MYEVVWENEQQRNGLHLSRNGNIPIYLIFSFEFNQKECIAKFNVFDTLSICIVMGQIKRK